MHEAIPIPRQWPGEPAVVIGTGPSLTGNQVGLCRQAGLKLIGVNNTWELVTLDVHVTVNPEWWDVFMEEENDLWLMTQQMDCWTSEQSAADKWGLKRFGWTDDAEVRGLSLNPLDVSLGHSSGFAALNIAYLMGCDPIILIGHDMRYPKGYDGRKKKPGGLRHYFGEYKDKRLGHWPVVKVRSTGELDGLINCYNAITARPALCKIINCTPGSSLEMFQKRDLLEVLNDIRSS